MNVPLFINGEEAKSGSGETFSRENPADTTDIVAIVEHASQDQVSHAVEAARQAFDNKEWSNNHRARVKILYKTAQLLRERKEELASLLIKEIGMPKRQAAPHILAAADIFEFYAGYADKIYGESYYLSNMDYIAIVKEPIGVAALITPWNFPYTQSARKIAPALATGCTVVYKPASYAPIAGYEMTKILHEAGIPKGVVNLVYGAGSTVGNWLVGSKVDKISFTGETTTGISISKLAAETLKRVSLELGGKNPFILLDDANIDNALKALLFGGFRNAGQACGATSRLLISKKMEDKIIRKLELYGKNLRVGNPLEETTDIGPLISGEQERRVMNYIKEGRERYNLIFGGNKLKNVALAKGYFVEPTAFAGVDPDSRLAKEEIFGPVISLISFENEEEAIKLANDVVYGLTAAIWTDNIGKAFRFAAAIRSGTVWINDNYTQPVEGIWGGYKYSGIGRELSHYGLDDFLETKQIYVNTSSEAMKPWYKQVVGF